jgi:hypothetical protein
MTGQASRACSWIPTPIMRELSHAIDAISRAQFRRCDRLRASVQKPQLQSQCPRRLHQAPYLYKIHDRIAPGGARRGMRCRLHYGGPLEPAPGLAQMDCVAVVPNLAQVPSNSQLAVGRGEPSVEHGRGQSRRDRSPALCGARYGASPTEAELDALPPELRRYFEEAHQPFYITILRHRGVPRDAPLPPAKQTAPGWGSVPKICQISGHFVSSAVRS